MTFPTGKLPPEVLSRLLQHRAAADPNVLIGPGIGLDAAAIAVDDAVIVAKSDPITFATEEIGFYAVNVNANDVACMGAEPRWFLATLLLPEAQTDEALVERIFMQLHHACDALGITLIGGHTEITYGLDRPIIAGHMLGLTRRERLVDARHAQPGDAVLLVRGFPIEGAAIIAHEKAEALRALGFDETTIAAARNFLHDPGISVVAAARLALDTAPVHALHDPTEGGVATGLWELAEAARAGILVQEEALQPLPLAAALCAAFGLDPLGTIASGALLLVAPPDAVETHLAAFAAANIPAAVVGELRPLEEGRWLVKNGERRPLPRFDADEITRLFT